MTVTNTWTASRSGAGEIERIELRENGSPLSFRRCFDLLRNNEEFARWYTGLLNESRFAAYFWENPPLDRTTIDAGVEFVLVDAPMLERVPPDAAPFRSYFGNGAIAVFRNLGGDAILIAPPPDDSSPGHAHLAAFLRTAPRPRVQSFWRTIAGTVVESVTDEPLWLSTAGLGVAWLHVRLDTSPKYYQHGPYRRRPARNQRSVGEPDS